MLCFQKIPNQVRNDAHRIYNIILSYVIPGLTRDLLLLLHKINKMPVYLHPQTLQQWNFFTQKT